MQVIARWQSPKGKHWVELLEFDNGGYCYRGNGCGGNLTLSTRDQAIAEVQAKVDSGYFLPDNAKLPMKQIFLSA